MYTAGLQFKHRVSSVVPLHRRVMRTGALSSTTGIDNNTNTIPRFTNSASLFSPTRPMLKKNKLHIIPPSSSTTNTSPPAESSPPVHLDSNIVSLSSSSSKACQHLQEKGIIILKHPSAVAEDKESIFEAFGIYHPVLTREDIEAAVSYLREDPTIDSATHPGMYAGIVFVSANEGERIVSSSTEESDGNKGNEMEKSSWEIVSEDDGEKGAGAHLRMMFTRHSRSVKHGTAVIVTRWFGGIMLGPKRFKHIVNVAEKCLKAHNLL
eukprot:Tbor_TRINITY_DN3730_c0_g1::TRINITY_DN3730_c0_g1_i1::g.2328::m.2328